jgi:uncharacterized protein (TIGR00369 family)
MKALLSPYAQTMGFIIEREDGGQLVVKMPSSELKLGRPGFVHGGALAGLLETVALATLSEALNDENVALKPINVTVTYMRGAVEMVSCARATIERLGRRIANVEAVAWQDDPERPVAIAQVNIMLARKDAP